MDNQKPRVGFVFYGALVILLIMAIVGVAIPQSFFNASSVVRSFVSTHFGWYYLLIVSACVLLCIYFIFSRYGNIRLGRPEDRPEYSYPTWFAMLFSSGMGVGLVFWSGAETVSHYATSAPEADAGTEQALLDSMRYMFLHWGIHPWAIYGITGICFAYFTFRRGAPGMVSAMLSPIMNEKGIGGKIVDIIALITTVSGIATVLGIGVTQVSGGMSYLFNTPNNYTMQLIVIVVITAMFLVSAYTGLNKGIKFLSNANIYLTIILFVLMLFVGPTLFSMNLFTNTLGTYLQTLPQMSFRIAPTSENTREWINTWTIFYWAWWISWTPFIGIFIARVSRGRTLKEFTIGVILVPSIVSFVWFSLFGGATLNVQSSGMADIASLAPEEAIFGVFDQYPLSTVMSTIALLLIVSFFITSADSATFVLGMQTSNGSMNPSAVVKFIWGVMLSATAAVLLYSGGINALQNVMIISALPFSIVMILMVYSLFKALREEKDVETKDKSRNADKPDKAS
ncbi:BCCT family transporter [Marinococcus halophilus]|uniref:BCCT family transporter n=1 Tax=Marinococcus halophilus TaxID=1371 RepID=UPI0024680A72|nr:BCCT family transporter [Marinococcus halophilus]